MVKKGRVGKTGIIISKNENYTKFKAKVKSKGLTIQGVFDNFIRKVADDKINLFDLLKD